jgi:hypothetical protein
MEIQSYLRVSSKEVMNNPKNPILRGTNFKAEKYSQYIFRKSIKLLF